MTTAATTTPQANASAPARVQALLVLLASLIFRPGAGLQMHHIFADAEAALCRHLLGLAIASSGRSDLSPEMFAVAIRWRGAFPVFEIRPRPGALALYHPWLAVIYRVKRARAFRLYRLRLSFREARSRRLSILLAIALRRQMRRRRVRHTAHARVPFHAPSRSLAPP